MHCFVTTVIHFFHYTFDLVSLSSFVQLPFVLIQILFLRAGSVCAYERLCEGEDACWRW